MSTRPGLLRHRPNPAGLRVVPPEQRRLQPSIMIDDLAAETGISKETLRHAIEKGELRGYYAGRSIAVFLDSVAEYQEGREVPVKPEPRGRVVKPRESRRTSAQHDSAVEFLRSHGLMKGR